MSVCEIIPKLWLGNINICKNKQFLQNNNIELIINCIVIYHFSKKKKIRICINDNQKWMK